MRKYIDQHQRMIELAETVMAAARQADADSGQSLTRARLNLARAVSEHVRQEIAMLTRSGAAHRLGEPVMHRYNDELLVWRRALMDCNCSWPPHRITDDPDGFVRSFRPLLDALRARVRWEEEQLYPKLGRAA